MAYLEFDDFTLTDPSKAKEREYIIASESGAMCTGTIMQCNTRKYHGLMIVPQPQLDQDLHVLLANLDETVVQGNRRFPLAVHQYPGGMDPKGYQYLKHFAWHRIPEWTCKMEYLGLKKSIALSDKENHLMIRYEVLECASPFKIQIQPFLAFRNIHALSKTNNDINRKFEPVENGISLQPYKRYDSLFMQFSRKVDFIPVPDWYYRIEYAEEQARGYDFLEDLYVPGYFEVTLKKGDQLIFSVGLEERITKGFTRKYKRIAEARPAMNSFEDCLQASVGHFIVRDRGEVKIIAGRPWFGVWSRDSFIALPGLLLSSRKFKLAAEALDASLKELKNGLFPNVGTANEGNDHAVDAPLWFFHALQQYTAATGKTGDTWKRYGSAMKDILSSYRKGTSHGIRMDENGLISTGDPGLALTWMDVRINGKPVTPRTGMPVEIEALWYNAVCFTLELAEKMGDGTFADEWKDIPGKIRSSFMQMFWDEQKGYLADCVNGGEKDFSLRPNQVIATALPHALPDANMCKRILEITANELLTPRGLKTLGQRDRGYIGRYRGNHETRDKAYHQGTVWPWLLEFFAEGYLKVHGTEGLSLIQSLYEGFEPAVFEHGIGTVSEVYDGDAPHLAGGAPSQAWSVAALLRIRQLINKYKETEVASHRKEEATAS